MSVKDKKFYWLKLDKSFFKQPEVKVIENMPNGKDYILFYLKLLCESVDTEGVLRLSDEIPYNADMLAAITDTNVDIVRSAVKVFTDLHLMEIADNDTIYMRAIERMIGSETYWAQRKKIQRSQPENVKLLGDNRTALDSVGHCPTIKEKEIEKEKDIIKDISNEISMGDESPSEPRDSIPYKKIQELYNSICKSFPKCVKMSSNRKKLISGRWNGDKFRLEDFEQLFTKAEASKFLRTGGPGWRVDIEWLIRPSNMTKVLEGKYDDRNRPNGRPENVSKPPDGAGDEDPPWIIQG